jgi:hypothetical protein
MESKHSEDQKCKWCKKTTGEYCNRSEKYERKCFHCDKPMGLCNSYGINLGVSYCESCFEERMSPECKWHLLGGDVSN